jgi:hypothetical protein
LMRGLDPVVMVGPSWLVKVSGVVRSV